MITFVQGNLFDSPAQVLCNTVNCVGVMGKGIALEFKHRFPRMFEDYKMRCQSQQIKPGVPYLWNDEYVQILNFPTKRHWRDNSLVQDIELGLEYFVTNYAELGIHSIAMPPLGCGNGGLNWNEVKLILVKYLIDIPDLEVFLYEPSVSQVRTGKQSSEKQPSVAGPNNDRQSALPTT